MNAMMNITVRVMAAKAQSEIAALKAEIRALEKQLGMAGSASGQLFSGNMLSRVAKWGSQMQWAGRQLSQNFTLPVVASGFAITRWALDNEAAMVRLRKVYGDGSESTAQLAQDMEGLAKAFDLLSVRYATNRAEVVQVAADWAAAGATGAALARATEATMQAMVLGEFEAAEATEALIAIQAQYGADTKELTRIIGVLNATENATGITFKGLVEGMARSAGVARSAGIDVEHLAAMLAAISPAAGSASQGGNALKTIVSRLLSPTKEAAEVLGAMGLKMDDVNWKSLNASERIEVLANRFHELEGSSDGMISSQAAVVSSLVASRWQINKFDVLMRDVYAHIDGNAETNGYYGKTLETLADKTEVAAIAQRELNTVLESQPMSLKRAGVVIQNSLMKAIQPLIPHIIMVANAFATLTQKFTNLDPRIQKAVFLFAAFLAVLGPPLVLLGSLAVAIGRMGLLMKGVGTGLKLAATGFGLFSRSADVAGDAAGKMVGRSKKSIAGGIMAMFGKGTAATAAATATTSGAAAGKAFSLGAAKGIATGSGAVAAAGAATMTRPAAAAAGMSAVVSKGMAAMRVQAAKAAFAMEMTGAAVVNGGRKASVGTKVYWNKIPTDIAGAMARANVVTHVAMTQTIPAAFAAGSAKVNGIVAGMHASLARASERNLMQNLAVLSSHADAAVAIGGRGAARMGATMAAANAAAMAGVASKGGAAKAAGAGMVARMLAGFKGLGPKIGKAVRAIGPWISKGLKLALRFFTGPWGAAIAAVIALLYTFRDQIGQLFRNIAAQFKDSTTPFGKAWAGVVNLFNKGVSVIHKAFNSLPQGVQNALMAVVNLVKAAGQAVYKLFSWLDPWQRHSPSLVERVTTGMKAVGDQFGFAVGRIKKHMLDGYSAMSRFGKATAGFMKKYEAGLRAEDRKILMEFAPGSVKSFNQMHATVRALEAQMVKLERGIERQQGKVDRLATKLEKAERAAKGASTKLDELQATLSGTETALQDATTKLEDFSSKGIKGQRAAADAAFENEMAQKKLQLAIAKLGDTDVSKLTDKLAGLQGEIESLKGEQDSLRASGAGGDILSAYDEQIRALEKQQGAINDSAKPINEMQKQLEDLQKQGEILDLENAIKFDPLIRQIDQLTDGYSELPFDQIVTGIKDQQAEVQRLTKDYNDQTKAVQDQQKVVDNANAQVEAARAKYDAANASLESMKTLYSEIENEISAIESAIQGVVSAATEMKAALEAAERAKKDKADRVSPGMQNFLDAAGGSFDDVGGFDTIGMEGGDIQDWIDNFTQNVGDMFSGVDIFGPIKKGWENFKGWWSTNVNPIFKNLGQGIVDIFSGIDWLAPFRAIGDWFKGDNPVAKTIRTWAGQIRDNVTSGWEKIKEVGANLWASLEGPVNALKKALGGEDGKSGLVGGFRSLWDWIGERLPGAFETLGGIVGGAMAVIGGVIGTAVSLITNLFEHTLAPVIDGLGQVFRGIVEIVTGVINTLTGLFTGDWATMWEGMKQIVDGIWDAIYGIFDGTIGSIIGVVRSFVETAIEWFTNLWDVLVGHSIIPDLMEAIWDWFMWLPKKIIKIISDFVGGAIDWFKDMGKKAGKKIGDFIGDAVDFFKKLPGKIFDKIKSLGKDLAKKAAGFMGDFLGKIEDVGGDVFKFFKELPGNVLKKLGDLGGWLLDKGKDLLGGLKDGIDKGWDNVTKFFKDLPGNALKAIGNIGSSLLGKGKDLLDGMKKGIDDGWAKASDFLAKTGANAIIAVKDLGSTLKQKGSDLMGGLKKGAESGWETVKGWFGGTNDRVKGVVGKSPEALIQKGRELIGGLKDGADKKWTEIKGTFSGIADKVKGAVGNVLTKLSPEGREFIQGLADGASSKWREVSGWFRGLGGKAKAAVSNPTGIGAVGASLNLVLRPAGIGIMSGFLGGMKSKYTEVQQFIGGIGPWIKKNKGPESYDKKLLTDPGKWIMQSLQDGLMGEVPSLQRTLNSISDTISNGLNVTTTAAIEDALSPLTVTGTVAAGMAGGRAATATLERTGTVTNNNTYIFSGDLSFPNITDGDDAETFIRNLSDYAGGSN